MNESTLKQSAMKCLIANFGNVEAERFISLIIKEPFNYTKWQENLYDDFSVSDLSHKAMKHLKAKRESN